MERKKNPCLRVSKTGILDVDQFFRELKSEIRGSDDIVVVILEGLHGEVRP